ncbi:MAG: hypothetical protein HOJ15_01945 [Candidatus Jacksonbacteria bacterium]|nr:hypothetical protein [Candidatus Jacksonbacteria bacterium]
MDQKRIKKLLDEASRDDCTQARHVDILQELCIAASHMLASGNQLFSDPDKFVQFFLSTLYYEALAHSPGHLSSFFTAFAMLCGNRGPDETFPSVNWRLAAWNFERNYLRYGKDDPDDN